jgi:ParB/RepB/Spo0J family partition protein
MEVRARLGQGESVDLEMHQLERRHADLRICDEGRLKRLIASLAELGQQVPVVVIAEPAGERERYVLIDGYLRVDALGRLGRDTVMATTWPLREADALLAHHHLCASSRSALEEAWLLARLREQGLGLEELARRLCRSKSWVSRRLALVGELSTPVQARVRAGRIPPHAAMKYLVPLARANRQQCNALCEALGQTRVSVREVAALYEGWRRADPTGRLRLCADPALYLRAIREQRRVVAEDAGTELAKDLATISGAAWRARQRVLRDGLSVDATYSRMDLLTAWRGAQSAFLALSSALEETWPDAGPKHADDDSETA